MTNSPIASPAPRRTRLEDIDPYSAAAARHAGRVTDVPDRRSDRRVTFNSAA
ncbi:hypothetical protein [Streptomyces sp. NPDC093970]|uniref:hypothetical protein n=1 Tax=unclassified Streptomyces TaxID=2593676 RepID=UPI003430DAF5